MSILRAIVVFSVVSTFVFSVFQAGMAQEPADQATTLEKATAGYQKLDTLDPDGKSMYTLYIKKETGDVLAHLPKGFEKQKIFFLPTNVGGTELAGFGSRGFFGSWRRVGDRLAFVRPRLNVRASRSAEYASSRKRIYTDVLFFDVPIVGEGPNNTPIVDLGKLFLGNSELFFKWHPGGLDTNLATITKTKVFAQNFTLSFEMPMRARGADWDGHLITIAYSISVMPEEPEYQPRLADPRVGYFTTSFRDLSRIAEVEESQRYIMRWHMEKADPELDLSPPKSPIVFYIDHKTPLPFRRWVKQGVLEWNKAFEKVGIVNAIEVYQQDAKSGRHMEKDPEDSQYNFVIWNSNSRGFSIALNRYDPRTGQIFNADVVMNDGWVRAAAHSYRRYLANAMTSGLSAKTRNWLDSRPHWDPQKRLATTTNDLEPHSRIAGETNVRESNSLNQVSNGWTDNFLSNGCTCSHGSCRSADLALARFHLLDLSDDGDGKEDKLPDEFVGALIKDVVTHEIGHVLGLRHNLKASSVFTLEQINSSKWKEEGKPISGSVMDYNGINYNTKEELVQGDYFMTTLGPYDYWAIRWGYSDESELEDILLESTNPLHAYLTDEDMYGPDPFTEMHDLGKNPLNFVDSEMEFVSTRRNLILERVLKKGSSYQRVRDAYSAILVRQATAIAIATRHVGAIHVFRHRVGDTERNPTEPVSAAHQRRALNQVLKYAFHDDSFGLTPELLEKMSFDKWIEGTFVTPGLPDPQLNAHDLVLGVQATTLTLLLDPEKLRRIYDMELRIRQEEDAFTVAELLNTIQDDIWSELEKEPGEAHSVRKPFVSSLRRNLQCEYFSRMIDLTIENTLAGAESRPVRSLATGKLRELRSKLDEFLKANEAKLDTYSKNHFKDAYMRIDKALQSMYTYRDN